MKFCSVCGHEVSLSIPPGDNRERFVCGSCGTVHYQNPRNVVGTVPVWDDKVLLCRRAIEPRYGYWTLPAGFMEMGETTAEGGLARNAGGSRRARRGAEPVLAAQRAARASGASVLPRAPARPRRRRRRGKSRSEALRGARDSVGRHRVPHRRPDAALFLRRPPAGSYGLHTGDIFRSLREG